MKKFISILLVLTMVIPMAFMTFSPAYAATSNETVIYNFLVEEIGFNTAAATGILANIYKESSFRHNVIEYGYTWENGGGYGICQWTNYPRTSSTGRRTDLVNWCSQNGFSYKTLEGQLNFFKYELTTKYQEVYNYLKSQPNSANGSYESARFFCLEFEKPSGSSVSNDRGELARDTYWPKYSSLGNISGNVSGYNPSAAAEYAKKWWDGFNPEFTNYAGQGGDCANFVSQCLHAGGLAYSENVWAPDKPAFIGCNSMKKYLTSIGGVFVENPSADDLSVGDIVYYYSNSKKCWGHVSLVVSNNGTPCVAAHTEPRYTTNWKLGYSRVAVLKLSKNEQAVSATPQITVVGAYSYECCSTDNVYDISTGYFDLGNDLRIEWCDPNAAALGYRYKVAGLINSPQPDNTNESAGAVWTIGDAKTLTSKTFIEIPSSKLSECNYIKIAVGCVDETNTEKWKSYYVPISPEKPEINNYSNYDVVDFDSDLTVTWSSSVGATSYNVKAIRLKSEPEFTNNESHDNWGRSGSNIYEKTTSRRTLTISSDDLIPGSWIKVAVCAVNSANSTESWSHYFYLNVKENDSVAVDSISVSPTENTLYIGDTCSLSANIMPSDATDKSVVWSSGDETVATVDSKGTVTAKGLGYAVITATTSNGLIAQSLITVSKITEAIYTVNFDANGGSAATQSIESNSGKTIVLPTAEKYITVTFDHKGGTASYQSQKLYFNCLGWSTSENSGFVDYDCGDEFTVPEGDITLYAVWSTRAFGALSLEAPVRDGYIFCGWSKDDSGFMDYELGEAMALSEDTTLSARWNKVSDVTSAIVSIEEDSYTIPLYDENGDPSPAYFVRLEEVTSGAEVSWSTDNSDIIQIEDGNDDGCYVNALLTGTAILTAEIVVDGKIVTDSCSITVDSFNDNEFGVYISDDYVELEASENGEPFGGEQSDELIIRSVPSDADISIYVEDESVATVGYSKKRSEDFYRASVYAIAPGETNLVAEIVCNGVTYTDKCSIKVLSPLNYGVVISESYIEVEASPTGSPFDGGESDELIIRSVPSSCDISIYCENTSVANVGFAKYSGEDFYRVTVIGINAGETNLIAETEYGGVKYTATSKIKVTSSETDPEPGPGYEEPREYTITLDPQGGTVYPESYVYPSATVIVLPTPVRSEKITFDLNGGTSGPETQEIYYGCMGWSLGGDSGFIDYECGSTYVIFDSDETLYAYWDLAAQGYLTDEVPVKDGAEFLGWTVVEDSTDVIYEPGESIALSKSRTLYAVWENQAEDEPSVDPDSKVPVSCRIVSAPVKTSYTYKIDTKADLTGMIIEITYSDGSKENITDTTKLEVKDFDTKSTGTKTVTVEYEGLTVQYNITVSYVWWQWIIMILLLGFLWY